MSDDILKAMRNALIFAVLFTVATMILTGCSVVYDSPNDNIEGNNNNEGKENNQEQNQDNSTAGATP
jgi:hypothetical protein